MTFLVLLLVGIGMMILVMGGVILAVSLKNRSLDSLKSVGNGILHWRWVKALLYWGVISVGTMSECVFLLASLWMTINSSVHKFVLLFMDEQMTVNLSWLATVAFVAVPEFILALALVTTMSHFRVWLYNKKDLASAAWTVLYGLPTLAFLLLSVVVISHSMLSTHYELPAWMVVMRGLAGYMYGFVAILYWQLGTPQEADRLREKDLFISQLVENARVLTVQIDDLKADLEQQKHVLAGQKTANRRLIEEAQKSDEMALQAYPQECLDWLRSGVKTALVEEICRFTGFTKRKITNANLARSPRNPDLILISALVSWMKNTPAPVSKISVLPSIEDANGCNTEELDAVEAGA